MLQINTLISQELGIALARINAAVTLLDSGATVPFIARYRKEQTGGLDDIELRQLEQRLTYLRELQARREVILGLISEQGKLSPEIKESILQAQSKQILEDVYLPFKLKRRTKGQIAKEAGLEPLADFLLSHPDALPEQEAANYVVACVPNESDTDKKDDFSTVTAVLDGVRDLLSERWAQAPALVQTLREWLWANGTIASTLVAGKDPQNPEVAKFSDYFDYSQAIAKVPSHRALAAFRGRAHDVLDVKLLQPESMQEKGLTRAEEKIATFIAWKHQNRPADELIRKCVIWTWRVKLSLQIERDLFARLREQAETVAIEVFADNVRDLLLAPPAGAKVVMGLDPGIRTGVKVAVVDATGKLLETTTVYPHEPRCDWEGAIERLSALCTLHHVNLIAIGNGTASRETDRLATQVVKRIEQKIPGTLIETMVVSEAGASIYSASEFASIEMPNVDVSLRGAVSIARRLQDPLAELVKIDPKAIGVGQYQHDVNQLSLARKLDAVVEDCVNGVGVDLNTASVALLRRVSGLGASVAAAVVHRRDTKGKFRNRHELLQVSGLGDKTYEQCAGFLRIREGDNPLDMTGVHPETYPVVHRILAKTGLSVSQLMGRSDILRSLTPVTFADENFGTPTVSDIILELEKPGRDPRGHFKAARFNEGIEQLSDLKIGMIVSGTVSNVAAFGAFVDVGVHQDGLVHVSELSHEFTKDARSVVRVGQVVTVKVLELDIPRKRISLTLRLDCEPKKETRVSVANKSSYQNQKTNPTTSMQMAFLKLSK